MTAAPLIPMSDRDGWIWYNGNMVPWRSAQLHVLTHGLHYASSVFEGERAYGGRIFKMTAHHQRLIDSARTLNMTVPYTVQQLNDAATALLAKQNLQNAYVRPVVWRGAEQLGVSAPKASIHVAIAAWEWPSYYPADMMARGMTMAWAKWRRPAPNTAPTTAKAAGLYMIATLCKEAAEAEGAQDALMLDYRGHVAEATSANFFVVIDGALHTPVADCFLNGITRQTVIQLAKKLGIAVHQRTILPDELKQGAEAFLTGTAAEIMPVGRIGTDLTFTPGRLTETLRAAYMQLTQTDTDTAVPFAA